MATEDQNCSCPACGMMISPEAEECPLCELRFCPRQRTPWAWYCRSWHLWCDTTGRATPWEFYSFIIPNTFLLIWWGNELKRVQLPGADLIAWLLVCLLGLYHLLSLIPLRALLVRRLHDRDLTWHDLAEEIKVAVDDYSDTSVWAYISFLYPLVWLGAGIYIPIREFFSDTLPGPNRFGPSIRYPRYNSRQN